MNRIFYKPDEKGENKVSNEEYLKRSYTGAGRILDVAGFSYTDETMYAYEANGQPIIQSESGGNTCTRGIYETIRTNCGSHQYLNGKLMNGLKNS